MSSPATEQSPNVYLPIEQAIIKELQNVSANLTPEQRISYDGLSAPELLDRVDFLLPDYPAIDVSYVMAYMLKDGRLVFNQERMLVLAPALTNK